MLPLRKQNQRFWEIYASLYTNASICDLRLQLCIPIQKIHPAVVQMAGREFAAEVAQLFGFGLARRSAQRKPDLLERLRSFAQVARAAGRHDVLPAGYTAAGTRHDMVKRQIPARTAILAAELVAQK